MSGLAILSVPLVSVGPRTIDSSESVVLSSSVIWCRRRLLLDNKPARGRYSTSSVGRRDGYPFNGADCKGGCGIGADGEGGGWGPIGWGGGANELWFRVSQGCGPY
jgi:hypothetical protein